MKTDRETMTLKEQLALSLTTYRSRGEYDGTHASAVACLQDAEFETDRPDIKAALREMHGIPAKVSEVA